jgi:two-component system chemotaxis sensor kinase CheA
MNQKEAGFLKRLLATFAVEAKEHITAISSGLIELEKASAVERQMEIIEAVFREAHSLKGAARAVNMINIEAVCQSLESVFASLKRREMTLSSELLDVLHAAVDGLGLFLSSAETESTSAVVSRAQELIRRLENASTGVLPETKPVESETTAEESPLAPGSDIHRPAAEQKPLPAETVRISTTKLDSILLQVEELLSAKLAARQRAAELREINTALAAWKKEWTKIYADLHAIEQSIQWDVNRSGSIKDNSRMIRLLEFFEWNSHLIKSLQSALTGVERSAEHDQRSLGAMVDNLLEDMKKVLMLPFSSLLEMFPKLVRDLARDQGKEVELAIRGGEIEIDRRILEEMKDPLIHLVRNGIDHGIEKPDERARKKKPPRGRVTISISQIDGHKVEVLISDDGAGIDLAQTRAAAVRLGIVSGEEAETLGESEALALIFQSGVSTSPIITDISGRGLGLVIVREKVDKLGGLLSVQMQSGMGTTFRIILPLTLAAFRGVLVRVDEQLFALPTTSVERVVKVNQQEIKTVENRETIQLDGQALSLVHLSDVLELHSNKRTNDTADKVQAVVLGTADKRIAFAVDEILNEQEVLVKSLGNQLSRVRNIAGATVLGTGKVVPILNVADLMKSAVKSRAAPARAAVAAEEHKAKGKSILVAEDSITARTLLKNILEAAGYTVKTAVDGLDALTALRTEDFDLVVSDVDMPRMSGFDLVAKIRSTKKLADLPVVLVTALESREDREHGIDVGANAYIVKSSFDQSNLLDAVRRLI